MCKMIQEEYAYESDADALPHRPRKRRQIIQPAAASTEVRGIRSNGYAFCNGSSPAHAAVDESLSTGPARASSAGAPSRKYIVWSDPIKRLLVALAEKHSADSNSTDQAWEKVANDFFAQPELQNYNRTYPRNLADRFRKIQSQSANCDVANDVKVAASHARASAAQDVRRCIEIDWRDHEVLMQLFAMVRKHQAHIAGRMAAWKPVADEFFALPSFATCMKSTGSSLQHRCFSWFNSVSKLLLPSPSKPVPTDANALQKLIYEMIVERQLQQLQAGFPPNTAQHNCAHNNEHCSAEEAEEWDVGEDEQQALMVRKKLSILRTASKLFLRHALKQVKLQRKKVEIKNLELKVQRVELRLQESRMIEDEEA